MVKKKDAYQIDRHVNDKEIEEVIEEYSDFLKLEKVPDRYTFSRQVLKLLRIPEDTTEKEHAQTLSKIAEKCYKSNATKQGDVFHSAARRVCNKYEISWDEVR